MTETGMRAAVEARGMRAAVVNGSLATLYIDVFFGLKSASVPTT